MGMCTSWKYFIMDENNLDDIPQILPKKLLFSTNILFCCQLANFYFLSWIAVFLCLVLSFAWENKNVYGNIINNLCLNTSAGRINSEIGTSCYDELASGWHLHQVFASSLPVNDGAHTGPNMFSDIPCDNENVISAKRSYILQLLAVKIRHQVYREFERYRSMLHRWESQLRATVQLLCYLINVSQWDVLKQISRSCLFWTKLIVFRPREGIHCRRKF